VEQTTPNVAFVSYDEKPGIQAISNTAPDLPPVAGKHDCVARDHEYKRHGTLSLLAGIDLLTGQVHACVECSATNSLDTRQALRRRLGLCSPRREG